MGEENTTQTILVVGGGITGMSAAIEAAEAGYQVVLVERNPYLGGRVAQLKQYFPKLCPPYCGLEINFRRMRQNPNIRFFTQAEVENISGQEGDFDVTIKIQPRYVTEQGVDLSPLADACTVEVDNPFNYGLDKMKAIYLPHELSHPMRWVVEDEYAKTDEARKIAADFPDVGLALDMTPQTTTIKVGAIIWATGWTGYDAAKIDYYNFNKNSNLVTNVQMERLAAVNGPTGGKIVRPSDDKPVKNIAFVQCAGSRDENHLPYCSGICCLASLKQATYVREQYPDAKVTIFFIDIRAMERLEDFYVKVEADPNVTLIKSKIAKITQDPETGDITLEGEDTMAGQPVKATVDMAVLATGMVPNTAADKVPAEVQYDPYGFIPSESGLPGFYAAGATKRPNDVSSCVQSATAAAIKAIQSISRR